MDNEELLQAMAQEIMALREEVDALTGGISGAVDKRKRGAFKSGFETKYPDIAKYKPIGDKLKIDIVGKAADALYNVPEGERDSRAQEIISELRDKFDEFMSLMEQGATEAPEAGEETMADASILPDEDRQAARALRGKSL